MPPDAIRHGRFNLAPLPLPIVPTDTIGIGRAGRDYARSKQRPSSEPYCKLAATFVRVWLKRRHF